jgi:hypothetical protein
MKKHPLYQFDPQAYVLAVALVIVGTAPTDVAMANSATAAAANRASANPAAVVRKQERKAFVRACTAPSKSPFPCWRR